MCKVPRFTFVSLVFMRVHQTVVGVVVAEDADHVTMERNDGRRLRIPTKYVIQRKILE